MIPGTQDISYHQFGEAFIASTVTPERIVAAVKRVAGDSVRLGPMRAGPAGAAVVTARGSIGEPVAERVDGEHLRYRVRIPVDLTLRVRVGTTGWFDASGEVELRLQVRTESPLAIVIDVEDVTPEDARFSIKAQGVPSRLLKRAADIETEVRRQAATYVNTQISGPDAAGLTRIDLMPLIESAWVSW